MKIELDRGIRNGNPVKDKREKNEKGRRYGNPERIRE
jgi:hypothetical protein